MRVQWTQFHNWPHPDDYPGFEDYIPPPPVVNRGELIGVVRTFGQTKAVVMRDNGRMSEVPIDEIRASPAEEKKP